MMPVALDLVDVADLTSEERAVALYASDMPVGRRRCFPNVQVREWIVQGAERLGAAEMRRQAEFARGWRLLELSHLVPAEVQARHEARFPNARRLNRAEQMAANDVYVNGLSEAARSRNGAAAVDGGCACAGTGRIEYCSEDFDPDMSYELDCPVHALRRQGASWVRGGY